MIKTMHIILLALFFSLPSWGNEEERFQKSKELYQSGKVDQAFELLKVNLLSSKLHPESLRLFSIIAEKKGNFPLAYKALDLILKERHPDFFLPDYSQHFSKSDIALLSRMKRIGTKLKKKPKGYLKVRSFKTPASANKVEWFPENNLLLEKKKLILRQTFLYSYSKALWLRGDQKQKYRGASFLGGDKTARRDFFALSTGVFYGLSDRFQVEGTLTFSYLKLNKEKFFGASKGESETELSEISAKLVSPILKYGRLQWDGLISYFHPGDDSVDSPVFLSTHDFSQLLGFGQRLRFYQSQYQLFFQQTFEFRVSGNAEPRLKLDGRFLWNFEKFSLGPGFHIFYATDGFDILDDEFNATRQREGIFPLDRKKERALHLGLFGVLPLSKKQSLDTHLSRVIDGENTGEENSFSLSFNHRF